MTGPENGDRPNYVRARTATGVGLIVLVAVLFLLDFASTEFTFELPHLTLLLGTALAFLGVEAGRKWLGPPGR